MNGRWIGLDLRHLFTFQAIADEGSFKAAARRLGYTPSAVSQQIASLERVVGVQLIAREHGRQAFGLTDAGGILLRHLVAIESQLAAAMADIEALSNAAATLRVGAYESVGARLLPELIGRVQERFPDAIEVVILAKLVEAAQGRVHETREFFLNQRIADPLNVNAYEWGLAQIPLVTEPNPPAVVSAGAQSSR